jgi:hypothetical protein
LGDDAEGRRAVTRAFRRRRDGTVVVTLPGPVVEVVQQVLGEVAGMVAEPAGAVGERLYPRAYLDPTEESAEDTWQSVVHDDLVRARVDAVAAVRSDLGGARPASRGNVEVRLDEDAQARWLTVLNDARLTFGTALGVTEDEELEFPPDDPRAHAHDCYVLLTALQGELVDAVLTGVSEDGVDDV